MCNKFQLLANIDSATVADILGYFKRLSRVYLIFIALNGISFINAVIDEDKTAATWTGVNIGLYFLQITAVNRLLEATNLTNTSILMFTAVAIIAFNIANLVYTVLTKTLWGLIALIGIVIQITTIYIIYKLREKVIAEAEGLPVTTATATPVYAQTSYPTSNPMSQRSEEPPIAKAEYA